MSYRTEIFELIEKTHLDVDIEKINLAYELAKESHEGQLRKSGEDYIIHPIEVTKILINMKMDTDTIIAGILHDVVEDTMITIADIKYNFGEDAAELVDGVTKLRVLPAGVQKQPENIRKMIVAMAQDVRVVIIKLADRLHNMRTLKYMKPEKQKRIATETLNIFAPLAHRMGMAKIKWELEDWSLYYLKPEIYREIITLVNAKRAEREEYTEKVKKMIEKELKNYNIEAEVTGRPKHFYSIYKKMYEKHKGFEELYDLTALRIIVAKEVECYNALGIIHNMWKPVHGRFKDYIAVPKSNGYQSIHTTIAGPNGNFVEIQIRSYEMHMIAEEGIAAHWEYKEKSKNSKGKSKNIYSWLRKILEWQNETDSSEEFIETVTGDLLKEEVFVFSPDGDVIELASGSTPLDFAFHIHTQVGYKCVGAKVNQKIVPLDHKLKNGDRVEIITSKTAKGPGKDWLKIVVTNSAKSKIRKWFKEQEFEEKVKEGKNIVEREFLNIGIKSKDIENNEKIQEFIRKHNFPNYDEFLFGIAVGKISLQSLLKKFKEEENEFDFEIPERISPTKKKEKKKNDYGVVVEGVENTVVRFAKCCTPLPGDDISGYVTSGKGIAIHRTDCKNYIDLENKDPNRIINVAWKNNEENRTKYNFNFLVTAIDREKILMEIINIIAEHKINIGSVNSQVFFENGEKYVNIKFTIEINSKEQYTRLVKNIERIRDVIKVRRL